MSNFDTNEIHSEYCHTGFVGLSTIGGWTFGITLVRMSVRPYVCMYVTRYLGDRSLLFPETLQLDRTWIGDKNVPSGFLNKALNPL